MNAFDTWYRRLSAHDQDFVATLIIAGMLVVGLIVLVVTINFILPILVRVSPVVFFDAVARLLAIGAMALAYILRKEK